MNDIDSYKSPTVIKHLKDKLYLQALSGHMHLKENLPVVDILPIIEEEEERVEEDGILEVSVDDSEDREKELSCLTEKDAVSDITFDLPSQPFIENNALESAFEYLEQTKHKTTLNPIENDVTSVLAYETSQKNLSNSEYHTTQREQMVNNGDKLPIKQTELFSFKEGSTSLTCDKESMSRRNHVTVTTGHIPQETAPHGECPSGSIVEKTMESNKKVSSKRKKMKFPNFIKWLCNLCCCCCCCCIMLCCCRKAT